MLFCTARIRFDYYHLTLFLFTDFFCYRFCYPMATTPKQIVSWWAYSIQHFCIVCTTKNVAYVRLPAIQIYRQTGKLDVHEKSHTHTKFNLHFLQRYESLYLTTERFSNQHKLLSIFFLPIYFHSVFSSSLKLMQIDKSGKFFKWCVFFCVCWLWTYFDCAVEGEFELICFYCSFQFAPYAFTLQHFTCTLNIRKRLSCLLNSFARSVCVMQNVTSLKLSHL